MRIFTLGKMGVPLLFFALFLFSGTYTYGQNCPTVADDTQDFCYLSTVADLEATANGDDVRWYRTATSSNPIPENELLQDGSYFAGNQSGTCNTRIEVQVTVDNFGVPTTQFGVVFQPCESSEDDSSTAGDLIALIQGNEVEIFTEEFSGEPIDPNTTLVDGNSYFAGQINPDTGCRTSRLALRYDPILAEAPTGQALQTFCPGATVADLTAEATNADTQAFRWFSTATSNPALSPSTPLIDGETYYASQIINRSNSTQPPCESVERFEVTVQFPDNAGEDNTNTVLCRSDLMDQQIADDVEALFLSLLSDDADRGGTFTPTIEEITQNFNNGTGIGTFSTTYTVGAGTGCEDSAELAVTVYSDNAGEDNSIAFCRSDLQDEQTEIAVEELFSNLLSEDADQGGTFSPTMAEITEAYNSGTGVGIFSTTYTVGGGTACQDSAELTVTVFSGNAGEDNTSTEFCRSELLDQQTVGDVETLFRSLISEGADEGGNFSPTIAEITRAFNNGTGIGTFSTTYTVGEGLSCEDSAELAVTVLADNAGDDNTSTELCRSDLEETQTVANVESLFLSLLSEDANPGGTFSPSIEEITEEFNSGDGIGNFSTTYTVGEGTACVDSAELSVTVNQAGTPRDDVFAEVCTSELAGLSDTQIQQLFLTELGINSGDFSPEGFDPEEVQAVISSFDPQNPEGEYSLTYREGTGSCLIETQITLVISEGEGEQLRNPIRRALCISDVNPELNEEVTEAYFRRIIEEEGLPTGGTFTPTPAEIYEDFQTDPINTFTTTYRLGGEACGDFVEIFVKVDDLRDAYAGDVPDLVLCSTNEVVNLHLYVQQYGAIRGGTFSGEGVTANGMFDPSIGTNGDTFTITYFVDDTRYCVNPGTEDSETFTVNLQNDIDLGGNISRTLCITDVNPDLDAEITEAYFLGIVEDEGLPAGGTFNPTPAEIFENFENNPIQTFTTTYSIGNEACGDSVQISVTVDDVKDANAGDIADQIICSTGELVDLRQYLQGSGATVGGTFSGEGVDENGMFDPSIGTNGDVFTITYSVDSSGYCTTAGTEDSEEFTITLQNDINLGGNIRRTLCITDVNPDLDAEITEAYFLSIVEDEGLPAGGSFNPTPAEIFESFETNPIQTFTTTYTVGNETCGDSVQISVRVDDIKDANAGDIADQILCSAGELVDLRQYLQGSGATVGGTFSGEGVDENGMFDPSIGTNGDVFTITYSVDSSGYCTTAGTEDSEEFTITLQNDIDLGGNIRRTLCITDVNPNLDAESTLAYFLSIVEDEGLPAGGSFNPTPAEIFESFETNPIQTFTTTYTVGNETCGDSVQISVVVSDLRDAEAGDIADQTICNVNELIDLNQFLEGSGATTGGTFTGEGVENGMFDPAIGANGDVFTITYSVDDSGYCTTPGSEDSEIFTITINTPSAPTVTPFTGCVSDGATVADLDITVDDGNTFVVYSDEAMETPVADTEVLTEGTYYVTQMNAAGCESSEAAEITVTLTDSDAPTLETGGNVFCEFDGATIADLQENVTGDGTITWYATETGTETVPQTTVLQNNTTYYAASTDATSGCESSQRLPVTVTLEVCEIVIPEAFSPNGDGINDRFEIENLASEYPNFNLEIYNRWGEPVYKGNSSTPEWDGVSTEGSFGSGVLPAGVYFYILYFNDGQTAPTQGRLYLSR